MCGFAGFFTPDAISDEVSAHRLLMLMRDQLVHRGPDDAGAWIDCASGVALGARRLSIMDLSPAGHQPMSSSNGRYLLVMNGEIYNYTDILAEVEMASGTRNWRGHCDTEVLVEAIALWGVEAAISRINGMFALAAWDRRERQLWLARDRIGKKPLYYGWAGDVFVFGSELKALWVHPQFDFETSAPALAGFLQRGYVLGEQASVAGIRRLSPGHTLSLDQRAVRARQAGAPRAYWRLRDIALAGLDAQASGRIPDEEELVAVLNDAVARRMVADVPVGCFLSGGIDSSLVAALMATTAPSEIRTFTIGFEIPDWDEARHARAVADHLGTRHEELYVTANEAMSIVHDLPDICDEPFADNSMIPSVLLTRMAGRHVTVALSGDGGDELFVGYQRYGAADRLLAWGAAIPAPVRAFAARINNSLSRPAAARWGTARLERRLHLLSHLLQDNDPIVFQDLIMSQSLDVDSLLTTPAQFDHLAANSPYRFDHATRIDRMTFMDTMSYLVDDILFKVDRASMAASLEVRCPLLDHRLIELAWRLPTAAKWSGKRGKLPLRDILYQRVPPGLLERPKMGFSAPVQIWVKNELREWAEALMSHESLSQHGLLDVPNCRKLWLDFTQYQRGWDRLIWNILMFQAWYELIKSKRKRTTSFLAVS